MKRILLIFLFALGLYLPVCASVSSRDSLRLVEYERSLQLDSLLRERASGFFEFEKRLEQEENDRHWDLVIAKILAITFIIFTYRIIFPKNKDQRIESVWGFIATIIIAFVLYFIYFC